MNSLAKVESQSLDLSSKPTLKPILLISSIFLCSFNKIWKSVQIAFWKMKRENPIKIINIATPPKVFLYPFVIIPSCPTPPRPTLTCFLLLYIGFHFIDFSMNYIIYKYSFFCLDSFTQHNYLRFIHALTCNNSSTIKNHFYWLCSIPLHWIYYSLFTHYQLMNIWVISGFWLLQVKLLSVSVYQFLYRYMLSFTWVYLGVERLDHMVSLLNCLKNCQIVFQSGCNIVYFQQQCVRVG